LEEWFPDADWFRGVEDAETIGQKDFTVVTLFVLPPVLEFSGCRGLRLLINPLMSYYLSGLNTTQFAHSALFGVYGCLALALMLLPKFVPEDAWNEWLLRFSLDNQWWFSRDAGFGPNS